MQKPLSYRRDGRQTDVISALYSRITLVTHNKNQNFFIHGGTVFSKENSDSTHKIKDRWYGYDKTNF